MDQALLDYPPVVVASWVDPPSKLAEALEVSAGDLLKKFCHVGHKLEWRQFFNVCPLPDLTFGHRLEKLSDGHTPVVTVQRHNLGHP